MHILTRDINQQIAQIRQLVLLRCIISSRWDNALNDGIFQKRFENVTSGNKFLENAYNIDDDNDDDDDDNDDDDSDDDNDDDSDDNDDDDSDDDSDDDDDDNDMGSKTFIIIIILLLCITFILYLKFIKLSTNDYKFSTKQCWKHILFNLNFSHFRTPSTGRHRSHKNWRKLHSLKSKN